LYSLVHAILPQLPKPQANVLNKTAPTQLTIMMSLTAMQTLLVKLGCCSNWVANSLSQIQGAYSIKISGNQLLDTTNTSGLEQEGDDDNDQEWQKPQFPITLPIIPPFEAVSDLPRLCYVVCS